MNEFKSPSISKFCYCITRNPNQRLYYTDSKSIMRRITANELERLQTFPLDWTKFQLIGDELKEVKWKDRKIVLGNAVTVNVIKEISKYFVEG